MKILNINEYEHPIPVPPKPTPIKKWEMVFSESIEPPLDASKRYQKFDIRINKKFTDCAFFVSTYRTSSSSSVFVPFEMGVITPIGMPNFHKSLSTDAGSFGYTTTINAKVDVFETYFLLELEVDRLTNTNKSFLWIDGYVI